MTRVLPRDRVSSIGVAWRIRLTSSCNKQQLSLSHRPAVTDYLRLTDRLSFDNPEQGQEPYFRFTDLRPPCIVALSHHPIRKEERSEYDLPDLSCSNKSPLTRRKKTHQK